MSGLNAAARQQLRWAGITQADWGYAHGGGAGPWPGDVCGCNDDRCVGYHHDDTDSCHCLETLIDELAGKRRAAAPLFAALTLTERRQLRARLRGGHARARAEALRPGRGIEAWGPARDAAELLAIDLPGAVPEALRW